MINESIDMIQIADKSNYTISQLIFQYSIEHIDRWDALFFILGLFFLLYMIYYLRLVDYPEKYTSYFITTWAIIIILYLFALIIDLVDIGSMKHIVFGIVLLVTSITVTYLQTRQKFVDDITESKIKIYKNDVKKLRNDIESNKASILKKNEHIKDLELYKNDYKKLENRHNKLENMYVASTHQIEELNCDIQNYKIKIEQYKHGQEVWEKSLIAISNEFEDFINNNIPYNYRTKVNSMDNALNHRTKLLENCYIIKEYIETQQTYLKKNVSKISELDALRSTEAERLQNKYLSEDYALYVFNPIFREIKEIIDQKSVNFIYDYPYYSERDVINILIRITQNLEKQNMFMKALSIIRKRT